ncbi:hypothetical protein MTO96_033238 [Rhipicephalus appendiculatus]
MGRRINTTLPSTTKILKPKWDDSDFRRKNETYRAQVRRTYNRRHRVRSRERILPKTAVRILSGGSVPRDCDERSGSTKILSGTDFNRAYEAYRQARATSDDNKNRTPVSTFKPSGPVACHSEERGVLWTADHGDAARQAHREPCVG